MSDDTGPRCPWKPDQPCPWHPVGRDAEAIRLVALGWTDHKIADALGVQPTTVSHQIQRICRFLGLDGGRSQLAAWAGAHGLSGFTPDGTV